MEFGNNFQFYFNFKTSSQVQLLINFIFYLHTDDYEIIMIPDHSKEFFKDELVFKEFKKTGSMSFEGSHAAKPPKKSGHLSSTSFNVPFQFVESGRRNQVMICEGQKYIQNNKYGDKIYWKCSRWHDKCKARAITLLSQPECIIRRNEHNHSESLLEKDDPNVDAKQDWT